MSAPAPTPRTFRVFHCTTPEEQKRALELRIEVFVREQKFTMEDELDDKDDTADHFVMVAVNPDGTEEDAGTIRWWPKPGQIAGKLGRLCVIPKYRGGGSGRNLVLFMEDHIRRRQGKAGAALAGENSVLSVAHSQAYATGFYAKLGYKQEGEMFLEDGADHMKMVKELQLDPEA
ncbi:hypothetical protein JCM8097_009454 [Rhodosporidiobolus ruineniae]